jgi:hypothetical protein
MSIDFKCTVKEDNSVKWHGLTMGKTEVVARNDRAKLISFLIAGHGYWAGVGDRAYAPAHFIVCKFVHIKFDGKSEVLGVEFFNNLLEWNVRRS